MRARARMHLCPRGRECTCARAGAQTRARGARRVPLSVCACACAPAQLLLLAAEYALAAACADVLACAQPNWLRVEPPAQERRAHLESASRAHLERVSSTFEAHCGHI
eukprot:6182132-Pleurochrysis_carterae.AAC.2